MDPRNPQREVGTSRPADGLVASSAEARVPRGPTAQGPPVSALPPLEQHVPHGIAKSVVPTGDHREPAPDDESLVRESWVSVATSAASRDSGVPSIFSSVRASTTSSSTRYSLRQSSIDSPIPASPLDNQYRKGSLPHTSRYCCTFCDAVFDSKTEWKLHELESHDRRERYVCKSCSAVFPRATLLAEHAKDIHGHEATPDTLTVEYAPIRSAWGCGFCAGAILSRNSYLEHVGEHYDEGRLRSEWQHTRVIEGLLRQPRIDAAWAALVHREEHVRGVKLRFRWDPVTTGRALEPYGSQSLQDSLEFFATGTKTSDQLAAEALKSAQIRLEGNVSDLVTRLYLRNPTSRPADMVKDVSHLSPDLHQNVPGTAEDVISPMESLPAPLRPPTAPPRISYPEPAEFGSETSDTTLDSIPKVREPEQIARAVDKNQLPSASAPGPLFSSQLRQVGHPIVTGQPKHSSRLRHVESARSLKPSGDLAGRQTPQYDSATPLAHMLWLDTSRVLNQRAAAQSRFQVPASPTEPFSPEVGGLRPSPDEDSAAFSVKMHASTSTLSTFTGRESEQLTDSASETLSNDSYSEPELWTEIDTIHGTTKTWRASFRQALDRGMRQLWVRFNRDWDALITQCVHDRGSDFSQSWAASGQRHQGASSQHLQPNGFLHPNGRSGGQDNEEEDEDEGEGFRLPSSMPRGGLESTKRFACPFRKHDPHRFNIRDHEICAIRSWSTISRLKEHLYRKHYKTHCARCKQTFGDAKELADHEMSVVGCEVLDRAAPCDLTTYQEKQLKSRKHTTRRQSEEEKWRDIYRLLFPDQEVPSPYPEPGEDLRTGASESHANLDFQHFLLTEMPGLVTKTAQEHAGRHLQSHEGLPMEAIPRIIESALHKAFRAWEARGSELPTREASLASMAFLPETANSLGFAYGQPTPAYPGPPAAAAGGHGFAGRNFAGGDLPSGLQHHAQSQADDSGFFEHGFFTSGPSPSYNAFTPQYGRGNWGSGLDLIGDGAFGSNSNMGGQFRGFEGA